MSDEGRQKIAAASEPATLEGQTASHASGGIPIQCQYCVGRNFRRSRWRKGDLLQVLLMRYPVRCLRCSQRQWVSFSVAGISIPSHAKHVPERAGVPRVPVARAADGSGPLGGSGR